MKKIIIALQLLFTFFVIASERPNIIFILTDDHRADLLGCMGNKTIQTPHIDAMAAEGVLFQKAFVTSAICTPSRTSFLLGQYERRHGINFNSEKSVSASDWDLSFPVQLRKNGYFTAYIGKNHTPIGEGGYKSGVMEKSFDFFYAGHKHLGFYPKGRHKIFKNSQQNTQVEIMQEGMQNFLAPKKDFYGKALSTLAKRPKNKPFFMALCFNVPHGSSTSTMRKKKSDDAIYKSLYRDIKDELPLPQTYAPGKGNAVNKLPKELFPHQKRQPIYNYVSKPSALRERLLRHMQTVTGVDRMVGKLRQELERAGVADNTIIVFSSDHGIMFGEHGIGGKSLCYEPCMHIPMIIFDPRAPKNLRGQRRDELVLSIDVAPTILSMAGIKAPSVMQGSDMKPLLNNKQTNWREAAFGENLWCTKFGNPRIETIRTSRFRYSRYFKNEIAAMKKAPNPYAMGSYYRKWLDASINGEEAIHEELYDLENDPHEKNNLANNPEFKTILAKHRQLCKKLVKSAR